MTELATIARTIAGLRDDGSHFFLAEWRFDVALFWQKNQDTNDEDAKALLADMETWLLRVGGIEGATEQEVAEANAKTYRVQLDAEIATCSCGNARYVDPFNLPPTWWHCSCCEATSLFV